MDRASEHAVWFVVGALVGAVGAALWHRLDGAGVGAADQVADPAAEPPPGLIEPKNPRLAAAGRKGVAASGMNSRRVRCSDCGLETTRGPMTGHQRATGHRGTVNA